MAATFRRVETIDQYSHDELIHFLTSIIPVVTVYDEVKDTAITSGLLRTFGFQP